MIEQDYGIAPEVMEFVDSGFLEVLAENPAEKTIEFHMPSLSYVDLSGCVTTVSLYWIHPDYNAEFCPYYTETPGDDPNFFVRIDTTDRGDELVDNLETLDDLVDWLSQKRELVVY